MKKNPLDRLEETRNQLNEHTESGVPCAEKIDYAKNPNPYDPSTIPALQGLFSIRKKPVEYQAAISEEHDQLLSLACDCSPK